MINFGSGVEIILDIKSPTQAKFPAIFPIIVLQEDGASKSFENHFDFYYFGNKQTI
jgi:hypothetical protein